MPKTTEISLKSNSFPPNNFTNGAIIKKYKGWAVSVDINFKDFMPREEIK